MYKIYEKRKIITNFFGKIRKQFSKLFKSFKNNKLSKFCIYNIKFQNFVECCKAWYEQLLFIIK